MQPKVSVIVAVYNVAPFLDKCLTSLKAQTLKDFEVILVDDGSTDNSGKMCDAYAREDNRFKVFHKANGGVASAREFGVEKASGLYMIHADPDDWVESTMLEELYDKAVEENADVVICDYYRDTACNSEWISQCPESLVPSSIVKEYLDGRLFGACWNKLVRLETWEKLNIHFPHINLCEDALVNIKMAMSGIHYSYLDKAFYHYVRDDNPDAITRENNPRMGLNAYRASVNYRALLYDTMYWDYYVQHGMPLFAYWTLYYGGVSKEEFKQEFGDLESIASAQWLVRLSLRCFWFGQSFLRLRKFVGRLLH